jgi:hypothetical protein|uniref:Uncharacterized protein n=1 Tax=Picea glauca TaxID=3330 RepID=A0A101LVK3_PICGL|nr:hypothetical protein ABT39_MTgene1948 [Picea glauca]
MPVLHAKVQCQVSVHALDPREEPIQESMPGVYALDQVEMLFGCFGNDRGFLLGGCPLVGFGTGERCLLTMHLF